MYENVLTVSLGENQTFTIPKNSFKAGKGKYTCSKIPVQIGDVTKGTAAATFDFNKCTFTIRIINTTVTAGPGKIDFNLQFAGFTQSQTALLK